MDPILGGALIGGAANLIGGLMGQSSQQSANQSNQASAREQMTFQKEMSDTAYQRSMKDMRLAGLNPMLAFSQGGASSPAGASATSQATDFSDAAGGVANAARDVINQRRERKLMESQVDLQSAQAAAAASQQKLNQASAKRAEADTKLLEADLPAIQSRNRLDIKRNAIDEKVLNYDAVINRIGQVMGIGSSAASMFRFGRGSVPKLPGGEPGKIKPPAIPPNRSHKNISREEQKHLSVMKDGTYYNSRTGEIYD